MYDNFVLIKENIEQLITPIFDLNIFASVLDRTTIKMILYLFVILYPRTKDNLSDNDRNQRDKKNCVVASGGFLSIHSSFVC